MSRGRFPRARYGNAFALASKPSLDGLEGLVFSRVERFGGCRVSENVMFFV